MKQATKRTQIHATLLIILLLCTCALMSQELTDSTVQMKQKKNVIRYNLSGALIFGFDRSIVFGYERLIRRNQSISVNFGKVSLPKAVTIVTDSLKLNNEGEGNGSNVSIDYRFYLSHENKFMAPHGLYIGPYYSYNHFTRDNRWDNVHSTGSNYISSQTEFNIHTIGFELGYQFVFWKKVTLDLLMVGPGIGIYKYKAKFDDNLDEKTKEQLLDALHQLLTQKYPGFNYVFSDKELNGNGTLNTTTLGYRYLIQVGFNF